MTDRAQNADESQHQASGPRWQPYLRFAAMIATATIVMYVLTYTNVFALEHIRFSEERVYMVVLMGSAMAIIMLAYMRGMYKDARINLMIVDQRARHRCGGLPAVAVAGPRAGRELHARDDPAPFDRRS